MIKYNCTYTVACSQSFDRLSNNSACIILQFHAAYENAVSQEKRVALGVQYSDAM